MLGIFIKNRKRKRKENKHIAKHQIQKKHELENDLTTKRSYIKKYFEKPKSKAPKKIIEKPKSKAPKKIIEKPKQQQTSELMKKVNNYIMRDLKYMKERFDIMTGKKSICEQRKEKRREIMRKTRGKGLSIKFTSTDQLLRSIICKRK